MAFLTSRSAATPDRISGALARARFEATSIRRAFSLAAVTAIT
jgi:hypothetical protein